LSERGPSPPRWPREGLRQGGRNCRVFNRNPRLRHPGRTWQQTCVFPPRSMSNRINSREGTQGPTWYSIELPMRYEGPKNSFVQGSGRTLAMNSRMVRFTSDQDLQVGLKVWLKITWPVQLPDGACLSLAVLGKIERSAYREVEVAFFRHEFRTRRGAQLSDPVVASYPNAAQTRAVGASMF